MLARGGATPDVAPRMSRHARSLKKKKKGNDVLLRLRMPKKVSLLTPDPHVDRLFAPLFPLIVTKRRSTNSFLRECVRSRAGRLFLTKKHRDIGRLQSSVIVLRK